MKTCLVGALALILSFVSIGSSTTLTERQLACGNVIVRKEWRSLPRTQQEEYIVAIKCMQGLPAITTSTAAGAVSSFDDFQGVHINAADYIHYVGHFLPWHRYYLSVYENTLRGKCGYTGGQPYWDWTLDYQNWLGSPIFDPTTGFGGNGQPVSCLVPVCSTGGGCISNGPFKDQIIHLGPYNSTVRNNYCLRRNLDPSLPAQVFNPASIAYTMSQTSFEQFRTQLEGVNRLYPGQHGSGHAGVGAQMSDFYASPADPLFYLHHANVDKLWWNWEQQNLEARLKDISGPSRPESNANTPNVTLDYALNVGILAPEVKIRDVMDIRGTVLCYDYQ